MVYTVMFYEWDEAKSRENVRKHGVSFEEAVTIFEDPGLRLAEDDGDWGEQRFRAIGRSVRGRQLLAVFCERSRGDGQEEIIRIISARQLTPGERRRLGRLR